MPDGSYQRLPRCDNFSLVLRSASNIFLVCCLLCLESFATTSCFGGWRSSLLRDTRLVLKLALLSEPLDHEDRPAGKYAPYTCSDSVSCF